MNKDLTILVATDFSETVMNAEHYAMQMAHADKKIFLRFLHAFSPGLTNGEKDEHAPAFVELQRLKQHVRKILATMRVPENEVRYECVVREGGAAEQIVAEAKETSPDFILMGTHGASGFREFVLGTQTWRVIKNAPVPVFALPKDVLFSGFKHIVFATEYREGELPVLNYIAQFAARYNALLTVLHITSSVLSQAFEKKLSADFFNEAKNRIEYHNMEFKVVHSVDVRDGLEDFAEQQKADLLIMSHEKPYLLERIFSPGASTTKQMSIHTKVPLLTVPDYYNPDFAWFWRLFALDYSMDTDL